MRRRPYTEAGMATPRAAHRPAARRPLAPTNVKLRSGGIRVDKRTYTKRGRGGYHAYRCRFRSPRTIAPLTPGDDFDGSRRDRVSAPCNGRSNADASTDDRSLLSQIVAIAFR